MSILLETNNLELAYGAFHAVNGVGLRAVRRCIVRADSAAVVGVGLGATAVAAIEQGQVDAVVTLDPAVTVLKARHPDLRLLADTRSAADTEALFGSGYPGGALYTLQSWIDEFLAKSQSKA